VAINEEVAYMVSWGDDGKEMASEFTRRFLGEFPGESRAEARPVYRQGAFQFHRVLLFGPWADRADGEAYFRAKDEAGDAIFVGADNPEAVRQDSFGEEDGEDDPDFGLGSHIAYGFASREDAEGFVASIDRSKLEPGIEVEIDRLVDLDDPGYYDQPGSRPWNVEIILPGETEPFRSMSLDEIEAELTPVAERFSGRFTGT
jgi:hypothetical protein